jgi:beta-lactamase regulating signal transducer with metallopeptidase domain
LNTLFVGLLGFGFATVAGRTLKAAISLRAIWRAAEYDATIDAHVVRSALPFSAVIGLFSQRIVLSTALAHALPAPLMRVVLAHERTHLLRHDSFWQLAAAFVSLGHFPSLRRHLLADLALAAEQACDERAADLSGDRLTVASTILFVERLFANRPSLIASAPAFGGSDVAARVDALLHPVIEPPVWMLRGVGVAIALLIAALTPSATLHHWTETLLGLLLG